MADDIEVFYVTATTATASPSTDAATVLEAALRQARGGGAQPTRARTELAKFFSRLDAEAHVPNIGSGYFDVRIEQRTEKMKDQHLAHLLGPSKGTAR
jgi:hypothetical protein